MSALTDLAARVEALAGIVETVVDTLTIIASAPAISAPAKGEAHERTFATKAERLAGEGFPCTADPDCGRRDLRTAPRGASHGADGHYAAKAKA